MNDVIESLGRVRMMGVVLLVVVFLAGGAAGAAGGFAWGTRHSPRAPFRGPPGGGMMPQTSSGLPPGYDRLGLSADQRTRIIDILERARPRTDSILAITMPRLRAITDSVRAEVQAVLTPAQRDELARLRPPPFERGRRRGPP
ncbi:MAG: hypothetical protein M3081_15110 [Gemmatimonadota bacterium]|nr:hypothetical protein [Gemmatimonadota bacterium]